MTRLKNGGLGADALKVLCIACVGADDQVRDAGDQVSKEHLTATGLASDGLKSIRDTGGLYPSRFFVTSNIAKTQLLDELALGS